MPEGDRIPCSSSPGLVPGHRTATGRKILYIALGAVALAAAIAVLLVRTSIGPATKSDWPPPVPVLRLGSQHRVAATRARAYDASGRSHPLAEILALRTESLERAAIGSVLESTIPAPAPTCISRRVTIPAGAYLMFDYGLVPEAWNSPRGGGVQFGVTVTAPSGKMLSEWNGAIRVEPRRLRNQRWRSARLDLSAHAGEAAIVQFATAKAGVDSEPTVTDLAMWGNPMLVGAAVGSKSAPNIVLIVIDALRADHVGCYGYSRPTTPNIAALALEGLRFARADAHAPWTVPSVAAMLTSDYPGQMCDRHTVRLAAQVPTFPAVLSQRGYTCAAVTANLLAHWGVGLDRGFDYFDIAPSLSFTDPFCADVVTAHALQWVRRRGHQPFFLYVHYMNVHDPYVAPEPFHLMYAPAGYRPSWPEVIGGRAKDVEARCASGSRGKPGERDISYLRDLYDGSISYVDANVGRMVKELERLGLRENTAIIVTADHGEEFFDHGWLRHGHSLHRELLRVPLIVAPPAAEARPKVITQPVGLVDIGATVLHLAGIRDRFGRGVSLLDIAHGKTRAEPVYSELGSWLGGRTFDLYEQPGKSFFPGRSLISGQWHLIARDDGVTEFYDLGRDPREQRNLAAAEPQRVASLRAAMEQLAGERQAGPASGRGEASRPAIDPNTLRQLRSMGYVR